jgi:hypothetical protein
MRRTETVVVAGVPGGPCVAPTGTTAEATPRAADPGSKRTTAGESRDEVGRSSVLGGAAMRS